MVMDSGAEEVLRKAACPAMTEKGALPAAVKVAEPVAASKALEAVF